MTISANCGAPTREDVITSIYTLKGVSYENSNYGNKFSDWSDVSENSKSAMEWAIKNGLIKGYDDNTIRPKQEVSQQEYETIMKRVASVTTDKTSGNYTDEMKIEKKVDLSPEDVRIL